MSARPALYQVITFATALERGNPAFVVTDPGEASDATLAAFCATLGAGVMAVIDRLGSEQPGLRFFTEEGAHPGAGHASLAAAHVALAERGDGMGARTRIGFRLEDGTVRPVRRDGARIGVGFPPMEAVPVDGIAALEQALGARPSASFLSPFGYTAVLDDAKAVADLSPDLARIAAFDRNAVIATAPGDGTCDIVVRVFAPKVGLPEDPVCGTAHRIIVPYWAQRLGQGQIHSRHLSKRGGDLFCEVDGAGVIIAGETRLVLSGVVELDP